jgi:hypothetical protein
MFIDNISSGLRIFSRISAIFMNTMVHGFIRLRMFILGSVSFRVSSFIVTYKRFLFIQPPISSPVSSAPIHPRLSSASGAYFIRFIFAGSSFIQWFRRFIHPRSSFGMFLFAGSCSFDHDYFRTRLSFFQPCFPTQ